MYNNNKHIVQNCIIIINVGILTFWCYIMAQWTICQYAITICRYSSIDVDVNCGPVTLYYFKSQMVCNLFCIQLSLISLSIRIK